MTSIISRFGKNYLLLHLVVFIWGFTAILGNLISVDSTTLVWHRMAIAFVSILAFLLVRKKNLKINFKSALKYFGVGLIIALHWICFFEAIKISNVSITLSCLSSATLFTAFIEPFFYKRRIKLIEVLFGIIIIGGLMMIFQFESNYRMGIIVASFSSFCGALFTVINGRLVEKESATNITLYEMLGGVIGISIYLLFLGKLNVESLYLPLNDLIYILILAIVCTAIAFLVSIHIMKELSPYTVMIANNLEPIYGIVLAFIFFNENENLTTGFYIGTSIILGSIFANAYLNKYLNKKNKLSNPII
jgi:drug/metabolite transporter (DMT)-like permease